MKLFKCSTRMTLEVIDLPRKSYRILPPRPWQVALAVVGIVVTSILWAVL